MRGVQGLEAALRLVHAKGDGVRWIASAGSLICSRTAPQHMMVSSALIAQEVRVRPTAMDFASVRPATGVGVLRFVVVPSPISPEVFSPQHRTPPLASNAHVCLEPATTW